MLLAIIATYESVPLACGVGQITVHKSMPLASSGGGAPLVAALESTPRHAVGGGFVSSFPSSGPHDSFGFEAGLGCLGPHKLIPDNSSKLGVRKGEYQQSI